jgi:hypothetical protein
LWACGVLFFYAVGGVGFMVFGGPNGEIPGFVGIPMVIAFGIAVVGCVIAPRIRTPAGEGWTELVFSDSGA